MNTRRFQDVWIEQCEAARRIKEEHGVKSAFDYIVGEKLMTYAQTAVARQNSRATCRSSLPKSAALQVAR